MRHLLILTLGVAFAVALAAPMTAQKGGFKDDKEYQWAVSTLRKLADEGILVGYFGFHSVLSSKHERPTSRLVIASATNSAYLKIKLIIVWVTEYAETVRTGEVDEESAEVIREELSQYLPGVKSWQRHITALITLCEMLDQDLRALGANPRSMQADLYGLASTLERLRVPKFGEAQTPFIDVPAGHWAYAAVHNMKREGILLGYPDGRFRGCGESGPATIAKVNKGDHIFAVQAEGGIPVVAQ